MADDFDAEEASIRADERERCAKLLDAEAERLDRLAQSETNPAYKEDFTQMSEKAADCAAIIRGSKP